MDGHFASHRKGVSIDLIFLVINETYTSIILTSTKFDCYNHNQFFKNVSGHKSRWNNAGQIWQKNFGSLQDDWLSRTRQPERNHSPVKLLS